MAMVVPVVVIVAACAPADSKSTRRDGPWYQAVVEPMQSDPDRIARFYDRLLTLKAHELAGELDATRQSFEKDGSELNRLQLALLLSLPGASFRDDNAAIALLHAFVKDKGREGSTLRPLAILLQSELLELRRTEEALQQQSAKLKEEQRRVEALQQKLEAILDMEMKMIEREQNLPKKK
ncbi:MAG: hypothetical protein HY067_08685 [Betaproteobacteria bacterium]|nr:hypothetical protein [Betaproteobacteria bacterium]